MPEDATLAAYCMWRWFGPTDYYRAARDAAEEMQAAQAIHPGYTSDPVRRAALVCEEAGEALKEALDLTRAGSGNEQPDQAAATRVRLYRELTQCASMALKAMAAMNAERDKTTGAL